MLRAIDPITNSRDPTISTSASPMAQAPALTTHLLASPFQGTSGISFVQRRAALYPQRVIASPGVCDCEVTGTQAWSCPSDPGGVVRIRTSTAAGTPCLEETIVIALTANRLARAIAVDEITEPLRSRVAVAERYPPPTCPNVTVH